MAEVTNQLSDEEVALTARALSIHRVSVRRKLLRMKPGTPEYRNALAEIELTTRAVNKFNAVDLDRASA